MRGAIGRRAAEQSVICKITNYFAGSAVVKSFMCPFGPGVTKHLECFVTRIKPKKYPVITTFFSFVNRDKMHCDTINSFFFTLKSYAKM